MAKIWLLQEGIPLKGNPLAEKTLPWCIDELGLKGDHWLAARGKPLIIGWASDLSAFGNPRYVVLELEDRETTAPSGKGWRGGYYLVPISVDAAKAKLKE